MLDIGRYSRGARQKSSDWIITGGVGRQSGVEVWELGCQARLLWVRCMVRLQPKASVLPQVIRNWLRDYSQVCWLMYSDYSLRLL